MKLLLLCTVFMVGCQTVPIMDSQGMPTGETETKFDADKAVEAGGAMAPFIGGPIGIAIPFIMSAIMALKKKD